MVVKENPSGSKFNYQMCLSEEIISISGSAKTGTDGGLLSRHNSKGMVWWLLGLVLSFGRSYRRNKRWGQEMALVGEGSGANNYIT